MALWQRNEETKTRKRATGGRVLCHVFDFLGAARMDSRVRNGGAAGELKIRKRGRKKRQMDQVVRLVLGHF